MDFSVRHAVPGRIRIHVPQLVGSSSQGDAIIDGLRRLPSIFDVRLNYASSSVAIEYDEDFKDLVEGLLGLLKNLSLDDAVAYFERQSAAMPKESDARVAGEHSTTKWPMIVPSAALLLSIAVRSGAPILTVPLLLYSALPTFRRAQRVLRTERRLNVDFLDTLAIGTSVLRNEPVTAAVITWLISFGDWIRDRTAGRSKRAVGRLMDYEGREAWLFRDEEVHPVSVGDLAVGDVVVVYAGDMIPVDGEIVQGEGVVDQKTITGEGLPVTRGPGNAVFAASILQAGQLRIRAVHVGPETAAGQIVQLINAAPLGDTRIQSHAERFADRLVVPTLGLAIGAALIARDINRFLSIVIVDIGTGIRIAAPTAILASITHAARAGIIIKSGGHMEKLAEIDTIVFDKTGTLSLGTPAIRETVAFFEDWPPEHVLGLAVAAETRLQHPVAEALRAHASEIGLDVPACEETQYHIGLGVEGYVGTAYLQVGSERFMRERSIAVDRSVAARARIDELGYSCLYVSIDGRLAGLIAYEDQIRPEASEVIATLHAMGITRTIMLTGDNPVVAAAVAGRLGISRHVANLMPADKADIIRQMQSEGWKVAMVGDGINDSPALRFADVGIAMKFGADIAHQAADVVLMEDSLWKLVRSIEIAREAVSLIRQNYAIVAGMNSLAMALCLPGNLVGPETTALISNGSAIIAGANGLRPLGRRS